MTNTTFRTHEQVLGFSIAADPFTHQIECILRWGKQRLSRFVCAANVHMLMEGHWSPTFAQVLHHADMLTPDGMPIVWAMNLLTKSSHERVCGIDLMKALCAQASENDLKVYFLGTDPPTLGDMHKRLQVEFPNLEIAGMKPLPFRPLTMEEDKQVVKEINDSQAGIVFIALGCPKQEIWMYQHVKRIKAVMVGVGGAFPMYAGTKKRAPKWVQSKGLEWLFRLMQEPSRLWKRYSTTIPTFLVLSAKQIVSCRLRRRLERVLNRI